MKLKYNSPVILTFTLISTLVLVIDNLTGDALKPFFSAPGVFNFSNPMSYLGMITHIFGHANWAHLVGNFSFILLLGPILEEKFGSRDLLFMIVVTAVITGILNALFFDSSVLGASGIVFMLILLSSFTNFTSGSIPITFILVVILFLGKEVWSAFENDNISQFGHIMGGICGSIFGFISEKGKIQGGSKTSI